MGKFIVMFTLVAMIMVGVVAGGYFLYQQWEERQRLKASRHGHRKKRT